MGGDVSKISIDGVEYNIKDKIAREFMGNYTSINDVIKEVETKCIDSLNETILGGVS